MKKSDGSLSEIRGKERPVEFTRRLPRGGVAPRVQLWAPRVLKQCGLNIEN
jgi:hypothetical protein